MSKTEPKPKLLRVVRRDGLPQVFIGDCELDIIDYSESVSRGAGHTISIKFPAEFVAWDKD